MTALLTAVDVEKRFGGLRVLEGVSLTVDSGERVGLIGPNGAGKTTFFNCLLGSLSPDRGSVLFDGIDVSREPVHRRARRGIARTFQRVELFAGMTPRQHVLVAIRARRGGGALWRDAIGLGRPSADELAEAQQMLEHVGLAADADRPVESLSLGRNRLVEIARALVTQPRMVFLDEPSSGLDRYETAALVDHLLQLQDQWGFGLLLVEHDVDMVRRSVERLVVMNTGVVLAEGPCEEVLTTDVVREAYLGEQP